MDDKSEQDAREVEAESYNLNYVGLDGNIGCLGKDIYLYITYDISFVVIVLSFSYILINVGVIRSTNGYLNIFLVF